MTSRATPPTFAVLLDAATGSEVSRLKCADQGVPLVLAWTADGHLLAAAAGGANNTWQVKIWDVVANKELRTLEGPIKAVEQMAFSPDGSHLVLAAKGQSSEVPDRDFILAEEGAPPPAARDQTAEVWNVQTGKLIHPLQGAAISWVENPRNAAGRYLLGWGRSPASQERIPRVWDAATGKEILTFKPHRRAPTALALAPRRPPPAPATAAATSLPLSRPQALGLP